MITYNKLYNDEYKLFSIEEYNTYNIIHIITNII